MGASENGATEARTGEKTQVDQLASFIKDAPQIIGRGLQYPHFGSESDDLRQCMENDRGIKDVKNRFGTYLHHIWIIVR